MIENLKSIRSIHNIIIVSCAALTILVFSKQPFQNIYDDALKEVKLILPTYETIRAKEVELVLDFYRENGILNVLNETFQELPFEPLGNYNWDFQHDRFEQIENRLARTNGTWSFTNMIVFDFNLENRVEEFRAFYRSGVITAEARNSQLTKWTIEHRRPYREVTVALYDGAGQTGEFGIELLKKMEIKDNYPHARDMVLQNNLVKIVEEDTITFPLLKEVWDVVKPLTIHEAKDALLRYAKTFREESAKPLSIFGLTIESRYASIVGPILVFSLLTYLLAHIKHFTHLTSIEPKDLDLLRTFPWLGLFDNIIGKYILFFTILIFPLISALMIVMVSDYSLTRKWLLVSIYSIVFVLLSGYLQRAVYLLKQELKQSVPKGRH